MFRSPALNQSKQNRDIMTLNEKLEKAYWEFDKSRKNNVENFSFKTIVRCLIMDELEESKNPLPDIENDIPMPEVKEPEKVKIASRPGYIELDGVKYFAEEDKEKPTCDHAWIKTPRISGRIRVCVTCGEEV